MMPHWDSTISPLGSRDPFGHHNVLVSSAIVPPGIIAKAFKPIAEKGAGGRTPLFSSCYNLLEGPLKSSTRQHFWHSYVKLFFGFLVTIFSLFGHASRLEMDFSDSHCVVLKILILFQ